MLENDVDLLGIFYFLTDESSFLAMPPVVTVSLLASFVLLYT